MPVHRCDFGRSRLRQSVRRSKQYPRQRQNSTQQVQAVRGRKNVKEAAARIGREKKPRGGKLSPGDDLTREKEHAEHRGDAPPVAEAVLVIRSEAAARTHK